MTDLEIARSIEEKNITSVASKYNLNESNLKLYGTNVAKVKLNTIDDINNNGKVILVTAINPTPFGEGKTTVTIGLGDALNALNENAIICLREPSLGPVFGIKGGATGGGRSQVIPMDEINLHFTGDLHAIESANNLLCAALDNSIYQSNELDIDINNIVIKRAMDMNDRSLRETIVGIGDKNGIERKDGYNITVASEVMAAYCLAKDIFDLKEKLGNIIVAYNNSGNPVYARDLNVHGAMTALLKDAINPNIVQTLEGNMAIIHGGPFANIAHGCNSIIATNLARKLGNYVVCEAGFGSDLGAEKFFDIKCRLNDINPSLTVLVATTRAIKYNGNGDDFDALKRGIVNLERHIENLKKFNVPIVVALNKFSDDNPEELKYIKDICMVHNVSFEIANGYSEGSDGCLSLARCCIDQIKFYEETVPDRKLNFMYDVNDSIYQKINRVAHEIYRAGKINYTDKAISDIEKLERLNLDKKPICIAKTQMSFSDDPKLLGAPEGYDFTIREVNVSNGAGFIVCIAGNIMTMPGLSKDAAYKKIDIDNEGNIIGIF
ncbi:MAG: formate--tetrahydrofolate ligase [Clostridia bacterium]|nr:formate--tetrahydrofolate ligase [Clostridia bacterium]